MSDTFIFSMATVIVIQNFFIVFLFWKTKRQERWKDVDTTPFYVYNGKAYWKRNGVLCRTRFFNNKLDPDSAEVVDQLNSDDLSPVDVVEILRIIDGAEK